MLAQEYETMRSVEDDYWWYRVLREITYREISKASGGRYSARILDAGCGTGGTLEFIRKRSPQARLAGFDISPLALNHSRARGLTNIFQGSVEAIALADESQEVVVSLDVLYHEGIDQEQAMQEFHRVLVPGGRLLMNLPAFGCLRGQHDVAVQSARRYTPREVRELHERNGFPVERTFCWNAWLFLPVLLWRKISRKLVKDVAEAKSDLLLPPVALNNLLILLGGWEAAACRAVRSPMGTSVFSVGVKK